MGVLKGKLKNNVLEHVQSSSLPACPAQNDHHNDSPFASLHGIAQSHLPCQAEDSSYASTLQPLCCTSLPNAARSLFFLGCLHCFAHSLPNHGGVRDDEQVTGLDESILLDNLLVMASMDGLLSSSRPWNKPQERERRGGGGGGMGCPPCYLL